MTEVEAPKKHYRGHGAWIEFTTAYDLAPKNPIDSSDIVTETQVCGLKQIAIEMMGDHSEAWFSKNIPALDNRTPNNILSTEKDGAIVVRELLIRTPS